MYGTEVVGQGTQVVGYGTLATCYRTRVATYTLKQLAKASGFARRTIGKYTQLGLIPRTTFRGPSTEFTDEHLARLEEISEVQAGGYITMENLAAALAERDRAKAELAAKAAAPLPPPPPLGKQWSHVTLAPGLVLNVREGASDVVMKVAREIVEKYGAG